MNLIKVGDEIPESSGGTPGYDGCKVVQSDDSPLYGIIDGYSLMYEFDFKTFDEAQGILQAHKDGARTFEEARRIYEESLTG